jgi:hypothetical protein
MVLALYVATFGLTFPVLAQNDPKLLDALPFDPSVPTSPAFTILGVAPKDVTSPPDAEGLGVSLLNATDQNGVLQSGIAIDTNPYLALVGPKLTIGTYNANYRQRFLSRMKWSLATTKASKESKDTHAALGILFVPVNTADPRLDTDLGKCLLQELAFKPTDAPVVPGTQPGGAQAVSLDKATQKELLACHEQFVKRQKKEWDAQSWMVGVAVASVTDNGKVESLESDGVGLWTSYSRQFAFGRMAD